MIDYDTLDTIADSVNPILATIALLGIGLTASRKRWSKAIKLTFTFLLAAVVAYGWKFIDLKLKIWHFAGLDYSTHTAVTLVLCVLLSFTFQRVIYLWCGVFIAYVGLMLYQEYHSIADIISTSLVISFTLYLFYSLYRACVKKDKDHNH